VDEVCDSVQAGTVSTAAAEEAEAAGEGTVSLKTDTDPASSLADKGSES